MLIIPVVAVFWQVVNHGFVWDDLVNVQQNRHLNPVTAGGVAAFWREGYESLYIPVTYTAWALQRVAAGSAALRVYHLANLLFHTLNALLVFAIARILVTPSDTGAPAEKRGAPAPDPRSATRPPKARRRGILDPRLAAPALAALVFALHPLQVEPVAWITGLKDVLCGFFSLVALWLYLGRVRQGAQPSGTASGRSAARPRRWWRSAAATAAYVLALLSKPAAVTVPAIAWVVSYLVPGAGRNGRTAVCWIRRHLPPQRYILLLWAALAVPAIVLTKRVQPDSVVDVVPPFATRLFVAADSLAFYIYKVFCPFRLMPDYGRSPQAVAGHLWLHVTWLVPAGLAVTAWFWRRERPWLGVAAAVLALGVLPVSGLVPFGFQDISTVADRYAYFGVLGPALAVACVLGERRSRTARGFGGLLVLGLAALSAGQARHWRDNASLFGYQLRARHASSLAHVNMGMLRYEDGRFQEAIAHYTAALQLDPNDELAFTNLGNALAAQGKAEAAMSAYRRALQLSPDDVKAHNNLGLALAGQRRWHEALGHYSHALRVQPLDYAAHYNLANALAEMGRVREAEAEYGRALRIQPHSTQARNNLAIALAGQGRFAEAAAHFSAALRIEPNDPRTHCNLGTALLRMGRVREAARHYSEALRIEPGYADARQGLGACATGNPSP
ncbi:MAG: tetratricopeptide repeat protein [Kiritimatiellae bacterium]|nr:tetratricopeptide repeat protein [Kiritimatiellia bacterium]